MSRLVRKKATLPTTLPSSSSSASASAFALASSESVSDEYDNENSTLSTTIWSPRGNHPVERRRGRRGRRCDCQRGAARARRWYHGMRLLWIRMEPACRRRRRRRRQVISIVGVWLTCHVLWRIFGIWKRRHDHYVLCRSDTQQELRNEYYRHENSTRTVDAPEAFREWLVAMEENHQRRKQHPKEKKRNDKERNEGEEDADNNPENEDDHDNHDDHYGTMSGIQKLLQEAEEDLEETTLESCPPENENAGDTSDSSTAHDSLFYATGPVTDECCPPLPSPTWTEYFAAKMHRWFVAWWWPPADLPDSNPLILPLPENATCVPRRFFYTDTCEMHTSWNGRFGSRTGGLLPTDRVLLGRYYRHATRVLEWGVGESTRIATYTNVPTYVGIDSSPLWLNATRKAGLAERYRLHLADVGPVGNFGHAIQANLSRIPLEYQILPLWSHLGSTASVPFDVYLVDGRYRVACVVACFLHAAAAADDDSSDWTRRVRVVIHDYWTRREYPRDYSAVERIADIVDESQLMAVLRLKPQVTENDLIQLWRQFRKDDARR